MRAYVVAVYRAKPSESRSFRDGDEALARRPFVVASHATAY